MQLPTVLNEIIMKLDMRGTVFDLLVGLNKCLDAVGISCWFHTATNIVIEQLQVQVPLILDDHVVENHTSFHDAVESFLIPKNEPGLEL